MKQKNLILMVVAVGCGLVAAFLTSQMSARSSGVEQIEVIVAAKDLPVGTQLSKDELKTAVKVKKVPKDGLPPAFVTDMNDLVDKRLSRAVRMEETFNPNDLSKGGVITLPPGMDLYSVPLGASQAAAGFVGPGSRVDVLATVRHQNRILAFPLLVNMLVIAVDNNVTYSREGTFPTLSTVSFAVDRKQAMLIDLARTRGCQMSLLLRNTENKENQERDTKYKIDEVLAMLQDVGNSAQIGGPGMQPIEDGLKSTPPGAAKVDPKNPADPKTAIEPPKAADPPKPETVKVLVATKDIPAGTRITKDLAADMRLIELPKALADEAFGELSDVLLGKELVHGLAKNQWITGALVGDPTLKPKSDRYEFFPPKDEPKAEPVVGDKPRRNHHDVIIHGVSGSRVFRYEEIRPGEWRLVGEMSPTDRDAKPQAGPEGKQQERQVD
jgi:Flp pilus assembly protein CpaB